jgi:hypothetical protein
LTRVQRRIVEALLVLAISCVFAWLLYPLLIPARPEIHRWTCFSRVKGCVQAQMLYADEHDERLPPATAWMDACLPIAKSDYDFVCPQARDADPEAFGLAMNVAFSSGGWLDGPDPSRAPLVFDSVLLARNACSGFSGLPDPPRHASGNSVGYLDGHAGRVAPAGKEIK